MLVSIHGAKTHLSKQLEAVARGERVVITRHGVPAAELVPARRSGVRIGSLKGHVPPPPADFLAPLSAQELGGPVSGVLLDTNAFAMVFADDPRLPRETRERIGEADRALLRVISLYEIGQKVRLGKRPEMVPFAAGLLDRADADGFDLLPLSPSAPLAAALLDWDHRDLFDRMIAVVARQEDLLHISSDAAFNGLGVERLWG